MDSIDGLGRRPERNAAFSKELLAETDDAELQRLVEGAAHELGTPIALVSLVLEHVQFFKAHYGLPGDLEASRGTHRDVSFCQFVVRDGQTFEVRDAANDKRVPQHLVKEYGIAAYLGMPLRVGETIVGSLCVLDTKPRSFSESERAELTRLADLANERILELARNRRHSRISMTERLSGPALTELRNSLAPVQGAVDEAIPNLTAVRSLLQLVSHASKGNIVSAGAMLKTIEAATSALEDCQDLLCDIDAASTECRDCISALDSLLEAASNPKLSDVLVAAQDLTRPTTRGVGGAALPDTSQDSTIHTPRQTAVALCSTCLASVAREVGGKCSSGLDLRMYQEDLNSVLAVGSSSLTPTMLERVTRQLAAEIGDEPTVRVRHDEASVLLVFKRAEAQLGA